MTERGPNASDRPAGDGELREEDRGVGDARDAERRDEDLLDELGVLSGTETARGEDGNLGQVSTTHDDGPRDEDRPPSRSREDEAPSRRRESPSDGDEAPSRREDEAPSRRRESPSDGDEAPSRREDEAPSLELGLGGDENLAPVSVTVDDEHLESMDQVVDALKQRGMHVDSVLESLGLVTGSTPDASALREVEGVSGVDTQLEHQIAPPEDEVQ